MKWQNSNIDIQFLAEHPKTVELIQQEISYVHDSIRRNNITLEQINIDLAELREMSIDYGVAS